MAFGIDTRSKFKQTKQNKSKNCVYYCDKRHKTMSFKQILLACPHLIKRQHFIKTNFKMKILIIGYFIDYTFTVYQYL